MVNAMHSGRILQNTLCYGKCNAFWSNLWPWEFNKWIFVVWKYDKNYFIIKTGL